MPGRSFAQVSVFGTRTQKIAQKFDHACCVFGHGPQLCQELGQTHAATEGNSYATTEAVSAALEGETQSCAGVCGTARSCRSPCEDHGQQRQCRISTHEGLPRTSATPHRRARAQVLACMFFFSRWACARTLERIESDSSAAGSFASKSGFGHVKHLKTRNIWTQERIALGHISVGQRCKQRQWQRSSHKDVEPS